MCTLSPSSAGHVCDPGASGSYNGIVAHGERDRRPSKLVLQRRGAANGVKPARYYEVRQPQMSEVSVTAVSAAGV